MRYFRDRENDIWVWTDNLERCTKRLEDDEWALFENDESPWDFADMLHIWDLKEIDEDEAFIEFV